MQPKQMMASFLLASHRNLLLSVPSSINRENITYFANNISFFSSFVLSEAPIPELVLNKGMYFRPRDRLSYFL